jgi:hypothetical protein
VNQIRIAVLCSDQTWLKLIGDVPSSTPSYIYHRVRSYRDVEGYVFDDVLMLRGAPMALLPAVRARVRRLPAE